MYLESHNLTKTSDALKKEASKLGHGNVDGTLPKVIVLKPSMAEVHHVPLSKGNQADFPMDTTKSYILESSVYEITGEEKKAVTVGKSSCPDQVQGLRKADFEKLPCCIRGAAEAYYDKTKDSPNFDQDFLNKKDFLKMRDCACECGQEYKQELETSAKRAKKSSPKNKRLKSPDSVSLEEIEVVDNPKRMGQQQSKPKNKSNKGAQDTQSISYSVGTEEVDNAVHPKRLLEEFSPPKKDEYIDARDVVTKRDVSSITSSMDSDEIRQKEIERLELENKKLEGTAKMMKMILENHAAKEDDTTLTSAVEDLKKINPEFFKEDKKQVLGNTKITLLNKGPKSATTAKKPVKTDKRSKSAQEAKDIGLGLDLSLANINKSKDDLQSSSSENLSASGKGGTSSASPRKRKSDASHSEGSKKVTKRSESPTPSTQTTSTARSMPTAAQLFSKITDRCYDAPLPNVEGLEVVKKCTGVCYEKYMQLTEEYPNLHDLIFKIIEIRKNSKLKPGVKCPEACKDLRCAQFDFLDNFVEPKASIYTQSSASRKGVALYSGDSGSTKDSSGQSQASSSKKDQSIESKPAETTSANSKKSDNTRARGGMSPGRKDNSPKRRESPTSVSSKKDRQPSPTSVSSKRDKSGDRSAASAVSAASKKGIDKSTDLPDSSIRDDRKEKSTITTADKATERPDSKEKRATKSTITSEDKSTERPDSKEKKALNTKATSTPHAKTETHAHLSHAPSATSIQDSVQLEIRRRSTMPPRRSSLPPEVLNLGPRHSLKSTKSTKSVRSIKEKMEEAFVDGTNINDDEDENLLNLSEKIQFTVEDLKLLDSIEESADAKRTITKIVLLSMIKCKNGVCLNHLRDLDPKHEMNIDEKIEEVAKIRLALMRENMPCPEGCDYFLCKHLAILDEYFTDFWDKEEELKSELISPSGLLTEMMNLCDEPPENIETNKEALKNCEGTCYKKFKELCVRYQNAHELLLHIDDLRKGNIENFKEDCPNTCEKFRCTHFEFVDKYLKSDTNLTTLDDVSAVFMSTVELDPHLAQLARIISLCGEDEESKARILLKLRACGVCYEPYMAINAYRDLSDREVLLRIKKTRDDNKDKDPTCTDACSTFSCTHWGFIDKYKDGTEDAVSEDSSTLESSEMYDNNKLKEALSRMQECIGVCYKCFENLDVNNNLTLKEKLTAVARIRRKNLLIYEEFKCPTDCEKFLCDTTNCADTQWFDSTSQLAIDTIEPTSSNVLEPGYIYNARDYIENCRKFVTEMLDNFNLDKDLVLKKIKAMRIAGYKDKGAEGFTPEICKHFIAIPKEELEFNKGTKGKLETLVDNIISYLKTNKSETEETELTSEIFQHSETSSEKQSKSKPKEAKKSPEDIKKTAKKETPKPTEQQQLHENAKTPIPPTKKDAEPKKTTDTLSNKTEDTLSKYSAKPKTPTDTSSYKTDDTLSKYSAKPKTPTDTLSNKTADTKSKTTDTKSVAKPKTEAQIPDSFLTTSDVVMKDKIKISPTCKDMSKISATDFLDFTSCKEKPKEVCDVCEDVLEGIPLEDKTMADVLEDMQIIKMEAQEEATDCPEACTNLQCIDEKEFQKNVEECQECQEILDNISTEGKTINDIVNIIEEMQKTSSDIHSCLSGQCVNLNCIDLDKLKTKLSEFIKEPKKPHHICDMTNCDKCEALLKGIPMERKIVQDIKAYVRQLPKTDDECDTLECVDSDILEAAIRRLKGEPDDGKDAERRRKASTVSCEDAKASRGGSTVGDDDDEDEDEEDDMDDVGAQQKARNADGLDVILEEGDDQDNKMVQTGTKYFDLDFRKLKKALLECDDWTKMLLLQALRWRITKSTSDSRDAIIASYIRHDLLGLHSDPCRPYMKNLLECFYCVQPSQFSNILQESMARLVNSFASLTLGRDYLSMNDDLLVFLLLPLFLGKHPSKAKVSSLAMEHVLATLQKLSLRKKQRILMINSGLVEFLVLFLSENHNKISSYCLEYSTALLMNLCLHKETRMKCRNSAATVVNLLKNLLDTKYKCALPYVNGAMYSLLTDKYINKEASNLKLGDVIQRFIGITDGEIKKQLEFIYNMHKSNTDGVECVCDANAEPDEEVDLLEPELEANDPVDGIPAGEDILKNYKLSPKAESRMSCLCRPVTPLFRNFDDFSKSKVCWLDCQGVCDEENQRVCVENAKGVLRSPEEMEAENSRQAQRDKRLRELKLNKLKTQKIKKAILDSAEDLTREIEDEAVDYLETKMPNYLPIIEEQSGENSDSTSQDVPVREAKQPRAKSKPRDGASEKDFSDSDAKSDRSGRSGKSREPYEKQASKLPKRKQKAAEKVAKKIERQFQVEATLEKDRDRERSSSTLPNVKGASSSKNRNDKYRYMERIYEKDRTTTLFEMNKAPLDIELRGRSYSEDLKTTARSYCYKEPMPCIIPPPDYCCNLRRNIERNKYSCSCYDAIKCYLDEPKYVKRCCDKRSNSVSPCFRKTYGKGDFSDINFALPRICRIDVITDIPRPDVPYKEVFQSKPKLPRTP